MSTAACGDRRPSASRNHPLKMSNIGGPTTLDTSRPAAFSLRKFPFRSQSLRLKRKSSKTNIVPNGNDQILARQQSEQQQPQQQQSFDKSSSNNLSTPCLTSLRLTEQNLIIETTPSNIKASILVGQQPIPKSNVINRLTRHQSIKSVASFSQANHQSVSQIPSYIIANSPAIQFESQDPPRTKLTDDPNFEDEGVLTNEESDVSDDPDDEDRIQSDREHLCRRVVLIRHPRKGLGISVSGGCDAGSPVTVVRIKADGPAQQTDDIFIGDQILSVNEVPLNSNTTHQDALRLLSGCGDRVTLCLKHSKAVLSYAKKWKHRRRSSIALYRNGGGGGDESDPIPSARSDHQASHLRQKFTFDPKETSRNAAEENGENECGRKLNLFMARISQYVSYGDKKRDASFEIQTTTNNEQPIVIHCVRKDVCHKWFQAIKTKIQHLTNNFMQHYNKHYPCAEHFLYMGFVSELVNNGGGGDESPSISFSSLISPARSWHNNVRRSARWLSRYLIVKGGKIYLFRSPPTTTLLSYKRKIGYICNNRCHNGSNGSSLGSVGSSTSEASNSSSATTSTTQLNNNHRHGSNDGFSLKIKPDRLIRLNKCLDNELDVLSIDHWTCFHLDFRSIKPNEQKDDKEDCFSIVNGHSDRRYFSTECSKNLLQLQDAWNMANYNSVIKDEKQIYTVVLEKGNIVGSFQIDYRFGFSFYDPKTNRNLWSYRFHQLRNSSDDGKELLSLAFMIDPSDSHSVIVTHVIRCSCLQNIIYCIHAFLRAKVFSLSAQ